MKPHVRYHISKLVNGHWLLRVLSDALTPGAYYVLDWAEYASWAQAVSAGQSHYAKHLPEFHK